jgi:hypothetical protein
VGDCGGGFGFDFGFGFGFGWGGGGHWDWGGGPTDYSKTPANVGENPNPPNGTLFSEDAFGGETQIPLQNPLTLLIPLDLGCDFGGCDFRRVRPHHPINGQWPTSWLLQAWLATHWPFGSPKGKWWPSKGTEGCAKYSDSGRPGLAEICGSFGTTTGMAGSIPSQISRLRKQQQSLPGPTLGRQIPAHQTLAYRAAAHQAAARQVVQAPARPEQALRGQVLGTTRTQPLRLTPVMDPAFQLLQPVRYPKQAEPPKLD